MPFGLPAAKSGSGILREKKYLAAACGKPNAFFCSIQGRVKSCLHHCRHLSALRGETMIFFCCLLSSQVWHPSFLLKRTRSVQFTAYPLHGKPVALGTPFVLYRWIMGRQVCSPTEAENQPAFMWPCPEGHTLPLAKESHSGLMGPVR